MRFNKVLAVIAAFFAVLPVCAQSDGSKDAKGEKIVLTIEDAVRLAKENNSDIKVSKNNLELYRLKNLCSWNSISPTLSLDGSFGDDFEGDKTTLSVGGSVNLKLSANLYTSIRDANLAYESGKLSYEQKVRAIELSVRKTFYGLLYEKENIELKKRNLETSEQQYKQNQEKFDNGKISELDVMTSKVSFQQKKPAVEEAEVTFQNDLAAFKQLIGVELKDDVELSGSLDEILSITKITFPNDKPSAPAPDIQSAMNDVEIAKNSLLASRFTSLGPTVSAGYSYAKAKSSALDDWTVTNQLSLKVSIPLDGWLPWSSGAVNAASSKTNLKNAEAKLENAKTTVAVNTENYLRKINLAVAQVGSLKANEELARQTYEMTRTAYNYGKTDLQNLQNSSDSVMDAGVSLKKQAYSLISSVLDLENLMGIPFGTLGFEK